VGLVQTGTKAGGSGGTATATLPSASTAGNFLRALVTSDSGGFTLAAPANWVKRNSSSFNRDVAIFDYVGNPGGLSSFAFTTNSGGGLEAQVEEWTPMTVDKTANGSASSGATVTATVGSNQAGDVAFTVFDKGAAGETFTLPGGGWSTAFTQNATPLAASSGEADDNAGPLAAGTISELQTSSGTTTSWDWAIATYTPVGPPPLGSPALLRAVRVNRLWRRREAPYLSGQRLAYPKPALNTAWTATVSDTVGPATDSVARVFAGIRALTDTVGPATDTTQLGSGRAVVDTVGPATDSVARQFAITTLVSDTVGPAADAAPVRVFQGFRAPSETVGPASDTLSRVGAFFRAISDTVGPASDTVAVIKSKLVNISDTLTAATDAVVRLFTGFRTPSDTVGPTSDTSTAQHATSRSASDTVGPASDSTARAWAGTRALSDTVGPAADTAPTRSASMKRSPSDTVGPASDVATRGVSTWVRFAVEHVGPTVDVATGALVHLTVRAFEFSIVRVRDGFAYARARGPVVARVRSGFSYAVTRSVTTMIARVREAITRLIVR
jgi:hypothetical protein